MKRSWAIFFTFAAIFLGQMPKGFAATTNGSEECDTGSKLLDKFAQLAKNCDMLDTIVVAGRQVTVEEYNNAISKVYLRWAATNRLDNRVKPAYVVKALRWAISERKPNDDRHELLGSDDACGPPNGYANTEDALITIIDHASTAQGSTRRSEALEPSLVAGGPLDVFGQSERHGQRRFGSEWNVQQDNSLFVKRDSAEHEQQSTSALHESTSTTEQPIASWSRTMFLLWLTLVPIIKRFASWHWLAMKRC